MNWRHQNLWLWPKWGQIFGVMLCLAVYQSDIIKKPTIDQHALRSFVFVFAYIMTLCEPNPNPNPNRQFIAFHILKTLAFKYAIFVSSPLGGRPIRFYNMIHVKNLLERSSHEAKLMPSFADGKVKNAFAARNSFD